MIKTKTKQKKHTCNFKNEQWSNKLDEINK